MAHLEVSARELCTIRAALLYWQNAHDIHKSVLKHEGIPLGDIAADSGKVEPLSREEVGSLCERLT